MTRRKEEGDGEGDGEVPRVNLYECSVGHRLCFVLNFFLSILSIMLSFSCNFYNSPKR